MVANDHNKTLTNGGGTGTNDFISDHVYTHMLILWPFVWLFVLGVGLWTNALIIRTFLRMGLKDSITISFFVLALSDFVHVLVPLPSVFGVLFMYVEAMTSFVFPIQPTMVYIFSINQGVSYNSSSTFIVTYLAIQRCLCIVKPLHFKDIFTKARTWIIMVVLCVISSVIFLAYAFAYKSVYSIDPATNTSRFILGVTPHYSIINFAMQAFFIFELISSNVLILGSMLVMGYALKASVRFREQISSGADRKQEVNVDSSGKVENPNRKKNESKERVAIMQVALLCTVFIITNIPKLIFIVGNVITTNLKEEVGPSNSLLLLANIRFTSDYINSSVNFPIYYKYNTKFRELCFTKTRKDRGILR